VFNEGRIAQIGTPAEVYEHPLTSFIAGFVVGICKWCHPMYEPHGPYGSSAIPSNPTDCTSCTATSSPEDPEPIGRRLAGTPTAVVTVTACPPAR